jgi:hypothetical protein
MLGLTGTLRGWAMLWQMDLLWFLPMLLVCVAAVALMESLISTRSAWPFSHGSQPVPKHTTFAVGATSIATIPDAIAVTAGGSSDFASDRAAAESLFQAGSDEFDLLASGHAE